MVIIYDAKTQSLSIHCQLAFTQRAQQPKPDSLPTVFQIQPPTTRFKNAEAGQYKLSFPKSCPDF